MVWHLKLLLAAVVGLPLHYAGRTHLGRPAVSWLVRALARFA